jgi:predicted HAD superfamily Cof-like phosphohydrolase
MLNEVIDFHKAFGHPLGEEPSSKEIELRFNLIEEEFIETADELADYAAFVERNDTKVITPETVEELATIRMQLTKELADMLYVIYGTAVSFDLPLEEVYKEVHRSNMSKLGEDGQPIFREDGKVLKGPNYKAADIAQFFFTR